MTTPNYVYKVTDLIGQTIEIGDNVLILPANYRPPYYSIFLGETNPKLNQWPTNRRVFLLFQNHCNTLKEHPFYKNIYPKIHLKTEPEIMLKANEHVIPWDSYIETFEDLKKLLKKGNPQPLEKDKAFLLQEYLTLPQGEWLKQRIN